MLSTLSISLPTGEEEASDSGQSGPRKIMMMMMMMCSKPAQSKFMAWVRSPTGPLTTHTLGPLANWGFELAVSERVIKGS